MLQEMSKLLKTQELENIRQAAINSQQGEVINRLMTCDRKCKQEVLECEHEVLETGKDISYLTQILIFEQRQTFSMIEFIVIDLDFRFDDPLFFFHKASPKYNDRRTSCSIGDPGCGDRRRLDRAR